VNDQPKKFHFPDSSGWLRITADSCGWRVQSRPATTINNFKRGKARKGADRSCSEFLFFTSDYLGLPRIGSDLGPQPSAFSLQPFRFPPAPGHFSRAVVTTQCFRAFLDFSVVTKVTFVTTSHVDLDQCLQGLSRCHDLQKTASNSALNVRTPFPSRLVSTL